MQSKFRIHGTSELILPHLGCLTDLPDLFLPSALRLGFRFETPTLGFGFFLAAAALRFSRFGLRPQDALQFAFQRIVGEPLRQFEGLVVLQTVDLDQLRFVAQLQFRHQPAEIGVPVFRFGIQHFFAEVQSGGEISRFHK